MTHQIEPQTMQWTQAMYHAAADSGVFGDRRLELIEGAIIEMSPVSSKHAIMIQRIQKALEQRVPAGYFVGAQIPLDLGEVSEPQPDVAIYPGTDDDYLEHKPTQAHLVIEVSDSSLRYDRGAKGSLYAKAGIPEYWIVNLRTATLEVYRTPVAMDTQPYGYGYKLVSTLTAQESISLVALPAVQIAIRLLVPPATP